MSKDQMQDFFPVVFSFVKGEQPTAEKLTGLVKHTDVAFSRISQSIGDPWDYAAHTDSGSARYDLSPENLAQTSIARIVGPSDYLGPMGGCWNEKPTSAFTITLAAGRNSWNLGFPLVKLVSAAIDYDAKLASVTPLVWGTDITVSDPNTPDVLATRYTSTKDVISTGRFSVDYYRGIITAYDIATSAITLTIPANTINMFGPGVPWGTHNVIPTWKETTTFCTLAEVSRSGGETTFTLTLPTVTKSHRVGDIATTILGGVPPKSGVNYGSTAYDASWSTGSYARCSGQASNYRLPASIASLPTGTEVPEGFCMLWLESALRFLPNVRFVTRGSTNSLTVIAPDGWLGESSTAIQYRLVVVGTSVSENISYLNQLVRNNRHVGISDDPVLSYSPALSHNDLDNRYTGYINTTTYPSSVIHRLKFRESSMALNPHPQYLHRYGYDANDANGNSSNAMRGNLVFTGTDTSMTLGSPSSISETYGILFGGGTTSTNTGNAMIRLEGLASNTSWTTGIAQRFPFGLTETGARPYGTTETYGALAISSWIGTPLYLRGSRATTSTAVYDGACLGFDLGRTAEYNYIKLLPAIRTGAYDYRNMPASTGQTATAALSITPDLAVLTTGADYARLSPDQIREFRFRGGAYITTPGNPDDSLGGENVQGAGNEILEFQSYFTSPAMVGTDWLALYSNAIFFSDTGDGKDTSFTTYGEGWLNDTSLPAPSGLYYIPKGPTLDDPYITFYMRDTYYGQTDQCLSFGARHGFWYQGTGNSAIQTLGLLLNSSNTGYYAFAGPASTGTPTADYAIAVASAAVYAAASVSFALSNNTPNHSMVLQTWATNSDMLLSTLSANSDISLIASGSSSSINLASTSSVNISSSASAINLASIGNITADTPASLLVSSLSVILHGSSADPTYARVRTESDTSLYINGNVGDGNVLMGHGATTVELWGSTLTLHAVGTSQANGIILENCGAGTSPTYTTSGPNPPHHSIRIMADTVDGGIQILTGNASSAGSMNDGDIFVVATNKLFLHSVNGTSGGGGGVLMPSVYNDGPYGGPRTVYISSGGTLWASTSLRDKKTSITSLGDISWIYSLNPVSFFWKDILDSKEIMYGFIAEETECVNSDLAVYTEDNKIIDIKRDSIVAGLVKAVQDQKKEIDSLKLQLASK
jgi:hypothetical protein